jgi:O-antigen/teichoic acid export membrane protein
VGVALCVSVLGIFAIPLALLLAVFLLVRHHADRSAFGLLVGMGLLSLYVAYVQRKGPGTVSWHTATASGSDTYLDPRPWLAAGLLLIVIGIAAFVWHGRKVPESTGNR